MTSFSYIFLTINRFERKKKIGLALNAFSILSPKSVSEVSLSENQWAQCGLIVAGGYDERVRENIEYYSELVRLACSLDIRDKVFFLRSISSEDKYYLLANSFALLYTPEFEHFGIVPIEAMYMKLPVIAHNSGGPKETIVQRRSGILCESGALEFSKAMKNLVEGQEENGIRDSLGEFGKNHVLNNFSYDLFAEKIDILLK